MLIHVKRLPLTVLIAAVVWACGCKTEPAPGDEDRLLTEDNGAVRSDSALATGGVKTANTPAGAAVTSRPLPVARPKLVGTGQLAPSLDLVELDTGTPWSLATFLDPAGESSPKGFLVAFAASWCQYCTESLPSLFNLERAYPDLSVVMVSVDDNPNGQQAVLSKVRAAGLTGPVLVADEATVAEWIGGGKSVPHYYFINHHGMVTGQDQGFGDDVKSLMPRQAARALAD